MIASQGIPKRHQFQRYNQSHRVLVTMIKN